MCRCLFDDGRGRGVAKPRHGQRGGSGGSSGRRFVASGAPRGFLKRLSRTSPGCIGRTWGKSNPAARTSPWRCSSESPTSCVSRCRHSWPRRSPREGVPRRSGRQRRAHSRGEQQGPARRRPPLLSTGLVQPAGTSPSPDMLVAPRPASGREGDRAPTTVDAHPDRGDCTSVRNIESVGGPTSVDPSPPRVTAASAQEGRPACLRRRRSHVDGRGTLLAPPNGAV